MTINSSLPVDNKKSSRSNDRTVNQFFNTYFSKKLEFASNEVIAVRGFFERKGFSKTAADAISIVLLQQAKIDGVKVFELIDTMKKYETNQLSELVTEILNHNRLNTSVLGIKKENTQTTIENRNIHI
jgi:hypothetical protein